MKNEVIPPTISPVISMWGEGVYRKLVENCYDGILLYDPNGITLYINTAVTQLLGYEEQELLGTSAFSLIHAEDLIKAYATQNYVLSAPNIRVRETIRFLTKVGTYIHVSAVFWNQLHEPGIEAVVCNFIDITAQILAQEETTRLYLLSHDLIMTLDGDGRYLMINPACSALFGYHPYEIIGKYAVEQVHPDDIVAIREAFQQIGNTQNVVHMNIKMRHKGGHYIPLDFRANYVPVLNRYYAIARDQTSLLKAWSQTQLSANRLLAISNAIPDVMILLAPKLKEGDAINFIVTFWNKAAQYLVDNAGKDWRSLSTRLWESAYEDVLKAWQMARSSSGINEVSSTSTTKWLKWTILPADEEICIFIEDITSQKQREKEQKDSLYRYQLLFEATPYPSYVYEALTGKILAANTASLVTFGYSNDELMTMYVSDLHLEEEILGVKYALECGTYGNEKALYAQKTKEGKRLYTEITAFPLGIDDKKVGIALVHDITIRLNAEEALRKSEANLSAIMKSATTCIFSTDLEANLLTTNKASQDAFQSLFSVTLTKSQKLHSGLPANLTRRLKRVLAILKEKRSVEGEFAFDVLDGSVRYYQFYINPIWSSGQMFGVSFFAHDISDKRTSQIQVAQSEKRYRTLVEGMSDAVITFGENGEVHYANEQVSILCSSEKSTPDSAWISSIFTQLSSLGAFNKQSNDVEPRRHQIKTQKLDGSQLFLSIGTVMLPNLDQDATWLCTLTDVTQEKVVQDRISSQENRYKTLVENMHEGVVYFDSKQRVQFANSRLASMLGYTHTELKNLLEPDLMYSKTDIDIYEQHHALRKDGTSSQYELCMRTKSGKPLWTIVNGVPLHTSDGEFLGTMATVNDISLLKGTEERLKAINQELNTFIYKSSHDLKGPLASMRGLCELALNEVKDETALQYIDMLNQSSNKLDKILLNLLETIRVREGTIQSKEVNVSSLIKDVLERLKHTNAMTDLDMRVRVNETYTIHSDYDALSSIIQNLLDNAIKYQDRSKMERWVHISAWHTDAGMHLEVSDNGLGIPEKSKEKVFNMFFRAHPMSQGTGLGLYIVQKAVERLQGSLSLETEEGHGSRFLLTIPDLIKDLE